MGAPLNFPKTVDWITGANAAEDESNVTGAGRAHGAEVHTDRRSR